MARRRSRKKLAESRKKLAEAAQEAVPARRGGRLSDSLVALEPRFMFDAAAVATGTEVAADAAAQDQAEAVVAASHDDAPELAADAADAEQLFAELGLPSEGVADAESVAASELVFVDESIEGFEAILAGIDPRAEIVTLSADRDGVLQIAEVLAGRQDVGALHIVSHGETAQLQLGSGVLTLDSMGGLHGQALQQIGQSLSADADILIYGCNFGQGRAGATAAGAVAILTGADVAASSDLTGSANEAGDWDLEVQTGEIETSMALTEEFTSSFDGTLPLIGGDAFLQGNRVEAGLSDNGSFGTGSAAPFGFHAREPMGRLGLVVDSDQTNWLTWDGDMFLPGIGEEGFGITLDGADYNNNQLGNQTDIPGSLSNFVSTATHESVDWNGSVAGLDLSATHSVGVNETWVVVDMTLTNTTGSDMSDVYYFRNVDPDNNQTIHGGYSTFNSVVSQPGAGGDEAIVTAVQADGSYLSLASESDSARVAYGGFLNRSAEDVWNGVGVEQTGGRLADEAISIAFRFDIAAGESVHFRYTYALDSDFADDAVSTTRIPDAPDLAASSDTGFSNSDDVTADWTPTFTGAAGAAEAGDTVTVYSGGVAVGSALANADGSYAVTTGPLVDGGHDVTVTYTNPSGAVSGTSAGLEVTIDSTPPNAPTIQDTITNDTTPILSGTFDAADSVAFQVEFDGTTYVAGVDAELTATAAGTWTLDLSAESPLADGSYEVVASSTDLAGNQSFDTSTAEILIDTVAPDAPIVSFFDMDTGVPGDAITSDATLVFGGTAESNAFVDVFVDGSFVGTTQADGGGAWIYDHTSTALAEGGHAISALARDAAGNESGLSDPAAITIDTTAPDAPDAPDLVDASDTGDSSSDDLTADTTPTFQGAPGSGTPGETVIVYVDGVPVGTGSVEADGSWTVTTSPLADGDHTVTATLTDAAGNEGAASDGLDVTIDSTPPDAPLVTSFSADTGTPGDGITQDATLQVTGTAEPGSHVDVYVDGILVGTTDADGTGAWSFDHGDTSLPDGLHLIEARASDAAGNASGLSAPLPVIVDTSAPGAPPAPDLHAFTDTGFTNNDDVTAAAGPIFVGAAGAGPPGDTVTVYADGVALGTATVLPDGAWFFFTPALAIAEGVHQITASFTDAGGNESAQSSALTVVIDRTAPDPPVVDGFSIDTGVQGDGITSDNTLVVNGSAEPDSRVEVFVDGFSVGTTFADGSGQWALELGGALVDGPHDFTARASDRAGNTSDPSGVLPVRIDTTGPGTPSVPDLVPSSDTGVSDSDDFTADSTPTFSGNGVPGATVTIYADGVAVGTSTVAPDGSWVVTTSALADGVRSITATQSDPAGNESVPSGALLVTIETATQAPPQPDLAPSSDSGASDSDDITADATPTVQGAPGSGTPGEPVTVYADGLPVGSGIVAGDGSWQVTTSPLTDGMRQITATYTNRAGVESDPSAPLPVLVDTVISAPTLDGTVNGSLLTGGADPGDTVTVVIDAASYETVADGAGHWNVSGVVPPVADGQALSITVTDTAGNTVTSVFTASVTPPPAPSGPGPSAGPAETPDPNMLGGSADNLMTADAKPVADIEPSTHVPADVPIATGLVAKAVHEARDLGGLIGLDPASAPILQALHDPAPPPPHTAEVFQGGELPAGQSQLEIASVVSFDTLFLSARHRPSAGADGELTELTANLSDGSALPEWMVLVPETGDLFGKPPLDAEPLAIELHGRLADGSTVHRALLVDARTGQLADRADGAPPEATAVAGFGEQVETAAAQFTERADALAKALAD